MIATSPAKGAPKKVVASRLRARDLMRTSMVTIEASTPLSEIERILSESKVSGAPVIGPRGGIIGVVSMRDLIERYAEEPAAHPRRGKGSFWVATDDLDEEEVEGFEVPEESEETAEQVMTAAVHTIDADAKLPEVARAMVELQIHRILVTEHKKVVGLISTMDVLRGVAGVVAKPRRRSASAR